MLVFMNSSAHYCTLPYVSRWCLGRCHSNSCHSYMPHSAAVLNLQKPLQHLPQAYLDHYMFQGNSPPTPLLPPKPTLTIISQLGKNVVLGGGGYFTLLAESLRSFLDRSGKRKRLCRHLQAPWICRSSSFLDESDKFYTG